jgi:hypothetical protein
VGGVGFVQWGRAYGNEHTRLGSGNWLSVATAGTAGIGAERAPLLAPASRSEDLGASGSMNTVGGRGGEKVRRVCAITDLPAVAQTCRASMCMRVIQRCP